MSNPKIVIYHMTKEGDQYTFQHEDGYLRSTVVGTIKEIAHLLFDKLIITHPNEGYRFQDGYGYAWNTSDTVWPPFWLNDDDPKNLVIIEDFFSQIEPEPDPAFWDDLNQQFRRFTKLLVFS
jgi:hypothetical protein